MAAENTPQPGARLTSHCRPVSFPIVWTIAGSDSGGGAGIQADLATMADLGCHGCSVISTLTAQSSVAVSLVEPVSDRMLIAQLDTLLHDLPPAAIKIGLLANQAQIDALAAWLRRSREALSSACGRPVAVILDPVMVATCGDELARGETLDFAPFSGLITLVTPNAGELEILAKEALEDGDACLDAARTISSELKTSVLAKGGDKGPGWDEAFARDLFVCVDVEGVSSLHRHGSFSLSSSRIDTPNSHGTGCTLSSAIAAFLAHDFVLNDAVVLAKAYVNAGLEQGYRPGKGPGCLARTGWPETLASFPHIRMLNQAGGEVGLLGQIPPFKTIDAGLGLYPVVADIDTLRCLLEAGAKTIQLRIKDDEAPGLERQIIRAVQLGRDYQARVFINDHWQLAVRHGAYGVHLGQEDLYLSDLCAINEAGLALGLSSHSYFEILLAQQLKPSYMAFGHIFETTTKQMPSSPQGLYKLARYVSLMKGHLPLVAIGGIDEGNLHRVKTTGVDDIAVVRAVTQATNPFEAFSRLASAWKLAPGVNDEPE